MTAHVKNIKKGKIQTSSKGLWSRYKNVFLLVYDYVLKLKLKFPNDKNPEYSNLWILSVRKIFSLQSFEN